MTETLQNKKETHELRQRKANEDKIEQRTAEIAQCCVSGLPVGSGAQYSMEESARATASPRPSPLKDRQVIDCGT